MKEELSQYEILEKNKGRVVTTSQALSIFGYSPKTGLADTAIYRYLKRLRRGVYQIGRR